jgi:two-component system sensor histidine kinase HydH
VLNIQALSPLLSAVVTFALGASVLLRDRRRATYTSFAALTLTLALYYLLDFLHNFTQVEWLDWVKLFPAAFIPTSATRFFRAFLAEPVMGGTHRSLRVTYAWTALWCLLILYAGVFDPIHDQLWFQFPFSVYVFGALYRCMFDLYAQYRRTLTRVEKARLRYLLIGGTLAITLAITDFLPRLGVTVPAIGSVLVLLYLYFLSQTLFRYRLLDLNELVGKMVVLASLVVILSVVYGLLLYWVGGGKLEGVFIFNTVVASTVILILFEPVRAVLEGAIHRWLVAERGDLRHRMESLRVELMNVIDVRDMVRRVLAVLEESRRVTHAAIYLLEPDGAGYELVGHVGPRPVDRLDVAARRPLIERVRESPLLLEALERELSAVERAGGPNKEKAIGELDAIARALGELGAALVLPVGGGEVDVPPALLCLRDERARHAYGLDDLDVFRGLAAQMAVVLENSRAYERMKERDRLAALGEMAAGLAHEIRNPLGAIKGAAQLLVGPDGRPQEPGGAEHGEFLGIIVEEVNRLNRVVSQFLDYARPYKPQEHAEIDVGEVVRKTVTLLEREEGAEKITIQLALGEGLPKVRGDAEQLRQVFLNLGINAVQAMQPTGGTLTITTRHRPRRREPVDLVEVVFADTGPGIPRDQLKHLFIPFFTTKEKGTGLGLPISQRIVSHHGGAIEVRSLLGRGSQFSVILPAADENTSITATGSISRASVGLPPGPSRTPTRVV